MRIDEFNALPAGQARQALLACCSSPRWASAVAAGRPYRAVAEAVTRSDRAVAALTPEDLRASLSGHPRIGGRAAAEPGIAVSWSGQEQSGVDAADQAVMTELAAANRDYEQRFGHIYLVCATGRTGAELLAMLRARLGNDRAAEWRVVRAELGKINRIRLRKFLEGTA